MYTDKKSILQLAVLLRSHGVRHLVLCPGSRNIPIVQTLLNIPDFTCYPMTDERSAGFFAIGLALHENAPAAVCCTSGTALLNLHPAVAEAFYQQVPLLIISADRPAAWIGQMDGQTLPQPGVFGTLVKKSVNLPEIQTEEDEWFCNRLINEALLELNHHGSGPVQINVPISDPFFQLPVTELPKVRTISRYQGLNPSADDSQQLIERLNRYRRRMVVIGQMKSHNQRFDEYTTSIWEHSFAWLTENLSNQAIPVETIRNLEPLFSRMTNEELETMRPELLITFGGHIISKRLKTFLRKHPPVEHWHIAPGGEISDLYGALTAVIEMEPFDFLEKIAPLIKKDAEDYPTAWKTLSMNIPQAQFPYSEMEAIGQVLHHLPEPCVLHLANSSTVRYAQLFPLPNQVEVLSNRGTNGIEGSLSTAIGYASVSDKVNFLLIGDLSFFYDMNALWNCNYGANLRILLLNNEGGEIFHALPGLKMTLQAQRFVTGIHHASARAWAEDQGWEYLAVHNEIELHTATARFTLPSITERPMLMEVFTDKQTDIELLKYYYHHLNKH